jgi:pyruvyltransferase
LLTPELFSHYGYTPIESAPSKADFIGVGSLLQMLPKNYNGTILGTGIISDTEIRLENATFAAVRGELSKKNLGLARDIPTGDLGLLAKCLLKKVPIEKKYAIGLIPHFVDKMHPWVQQMKQILGHRGCVIEVQDSATNVINQVAQCDLIVSSSLHGIIVSDALGIPNVWIELSDKVLGSGFKFWDYNSSIDYEQGAVNVTEATSLTDVESHASNKNHALISKKFVDLDLVLKSALALSSI